MRPGVGVAALCLGLLWSIGGRSPGAVAARQGSDRLLVVISDLHLGVGHVGAAWHATEDFRWTAEFRAFLDDVDRQGQGKTDLVIAGDAFELWQSLTGDCVDPAPDRGCTEQEALARFARVSAAHADELRALGAFARARDNRVIFVPGNHDAALLFPAVAGAVVRATMSALDRVRVEASGYWLSLDGQVLVEHGQQMGREVNKFQGWPRPFIGASPSHLERSWGEQFVQSFYNQYEARYPIIDNVTEEGAGIGYARQVEGWRGLSMALSRFTLFYLTKLSWSQYGASLGTPAQDGADPAWDYDAIRAQGSQFLFDSLPADDAFGAAVRAAGAEVTAVADVPDEDLAGICRARAHIRAEQAARGGQPTLTLCPTKDGTLGAAAQAVMRRSRDDILSKYLVERFTDLQRARPSASPFALYVYGHTHAADGGFKPMASSHPDWNLTAVNTGAWQRTVTPPQLESLSCRVPAGSSLIQLQPEDLPACYPTVLVRPHADSPQAELSYWTQGANSRWQFAASCAWVSPCAGR